MSAYQYVHGSFDYNKTPLAPLGCAVQIYESNTRRGTWAEHSSNGWYIGTSMEHYRCHIIYVKKTRSESISDTVFFKHKYITQPTVTPADTIIKALDDLTIALKGRKNVKGAIQIEALEKIDELLNNLPKQLELERRQGQQRRVTFDEGTNPPKEDTVPMQLPAASTRNISRQPIHKAIIDKPIQPNTPTPRVHDERRCAPNVVMTTKTASTPRVLRKPQQTPPTIMQSKIRKRIRDKAVRARLPNHSHMQLRHQEQRERVQKR